VKVAYISLGCPKNVSDLEKILGDLAGHVEIVEDAQQADMTLINTCAFIESSKTEAIDTILETLRIKESNPHHKVVVTGCLPQRYQLELLKEIPEVDLFIPSLENDKTSRQLFDFLGKKHEKASRRKRIGPSHYGYLKIAEGCNNRCSYCAIPLIKGNFKSFAFDQILQDANQLVESGAKEIIIVAQDTTNYGRESKINQSINDLLKELALIKEIDWIRLMYTHPAHWSDELVETIAGLDKVVKYIDLPIQHISDRLLKKMRRHINRSSIEQLIQNLRAKIPNLAIRTSVIVGFPGETENEFNELLNFIEAAKFERLGAFSYSKEDGTKAHSYKDDVPIEIKNDRLSQVLDLQSEIAHSHNKKLLGKEINVLVDTVAHEKDISSCRTQWDAPEIDNEVIIKRPLNVGQFYRAKVTKIDTFELYAEIT
jgi:ribosomal protein S12 methylthiotransferase